MQAMQSKIGARVYKPIFPSSFMEFKCNSNMLAVLLHLDGKSDLAAISQKISMPLQTVVETITHLLNLKLVASANNGAGILDETFAQHILTQLAVAVGPLAEVLIDDAMQDLGYTRESFPLVKVPDLVLALSKEIQREDKRRVFQQKMMERIKNG
jgi:hypothetical protein